MFSLYTPVRPINYFVDFLYVLAPNKAGRCTEVALYNLKILHEEFNE